ncbi:MAG TPA: class D sortase [Anaerolinea sp.]|nr:class D sortase [Anaerolinea sp.]
MARNRSIDDLSVDELRQLLIEKRRSERHKRLDHYRRTGRVIMVEPASMASPVESHSEPLLLEDSLLTPPRSKRRIWLDRALFVVEILAVVGMILILFNGVSLLRNLNNEVASVLVQPTLTPTPLVSAVILPSGHTPPTDPGGARFNEDEIPEHLRPLVQTLANIALPTPSPAHATRIQIPAIGVDAPVVQGDGWEQLKKGVGQHVGTPNPGDKGNIVLSAHNDVFGEIFRDLDRLKPGDEIILSTSQQAYVYVVRQQQIVEPTQVEVMAPSQTPLVTLISCYPYMVDNQRIVVSAELQGEK